LAPLRRRKRRGNATGCRDGLSREGFTGNYRHLPTANRVAAVSAQRKSKAALEKNQITSRRRVTTRSGGGPVFNRPARSSDQLERLEWATAGTSSDSGWTSSAMPTVVALIPATAVIEVRQPFESDELNPWPGKCWHVCFFAAASFAKQQQWDVPAHGQSAQQHAEQPACSPATGFIAECDVSLHATPQSHFRQAQLAVGRPAKAASGIIAHIMLATNPRRTKRIVDLPIMATQRSDSIELTAPLYRFVSRRKRQFVRFPPIIFGSNGLADQSITYCLGRSSGTTGSRRAARSPYAAGAAEVRNTRGDYRNATSVCDCQRRSSCTKSWIPYTSRSDASLPDFAATCKNLTKSAAGRLETR
jgi:hypothetical protein